MADKQEYGDMEGWVESDDFFCYKCDRNVDMPKWDGPYEYYETSGLHGRVCPICNRQLCDDCANWQKGESGGLICFECFDEERHSRVDLSIHNAIVFTSRKHDKKYRKSTDIPYIAHPMEVMQILIENDCKEDVIIAGILHDTIEAKLVCCADKLSNMRSIYTDLQTIGEKVWERFNADKKHIQWYYESILAAISNISDSDMYYDLSELIEDVFHLNWCNNDIEIT